MKWKEKSKKLDTQKKRINKKRNIPKWLKIMKKEFNRKTNLMKKKLKDFKVNQEMKLELLKCPSTNSIMKRKPLQEKKLIFKPNLQL